MGMIKTVITKMDREYVTILKQDYDWPMSEDIVAKFNGFPNKQKNNNTRIIV